MIRMIFNPQHRSSSRSGRIAMAMFRVSQAIKKLTQAEADAAGLSPVQAQALLFALHTRSDAATVGNLANAIGTTHVTAVKLVNGLVRKQYMQKSEKADDRRYTLLRLTPQGEELAARLDQWGRTLEEALESVPGTGLDGLELGLGAVLDALQRRGHVVAAEPCRECVHFRPDAGDAAAPHYCEMLKAYLTHEATLKECPESTPAPKH